MLSFVVLAAVVAVSVVLPERSQSQSSPGARSATLGKKIGITRSKIAKRRGKERVLSTSIARYSRRIGRLQGEITVLERKENSIQTDLDAKRAELLRVQRLLRRERGRLARLKARLSESRRTLAKRVVELYKADSPDVVTVMLESDGFADLLERSEFLSRIGNQDREILDRVITAKQDATTTAHKLSRLESRKQEVAATILARRNEVADVRQQLVGRRYSFSKARSAKSEVLSATRSQRHELEGHLEELEAEQAKVQAALQRAQARNTSTFGPSNVAGPVKRGSGSLIWPVNGPIVSPFGQRWGRLHAGVDIAVPAGVPIRAADSGKVVLLGWTGGYGNYTCVQHTATMSTCYAHQSAYKTSMGASVKKGQVIGLVGCTGHCFGDHLHFEVRINGSPTDPAGYL